MKEPITSKQIWLCILYTIVLIPFAILIDITLKWCFNNILSDILNWFNSLKVVFRIFFVLAGISIIIWIMAFIIGVAFSILITFIFKKIPANNYILVISVLAFLINSFIGIRELYLVVYTWNFWTVIEFGMLCLLIFSVNYSFLAVLNKQRKQIEKD